LFEGIFLTHAHMGHYAGLLHLGREAYAARGQPVHGSARMTAFLETQAPWELLVRLGHITLHTLEPDRDVELASQLTITPILVPHRAEYTDTLGFIVRGPSQSLLYIPDIDKWHQWERRLEDVLATVDHALIDGTFYADGEIPGRSMKDIPHPFIAETMARLASASADLRAKVRFTHLNHTNPAADPGGSAQKAIEAAGFSVARDGDVFGL
jgi:pyrroloquinoline quinone biosynthesis protein B